MQPISATQLPLTYPAAIFPARLEWLCQPAQIEHTLRLIYYLNFWKTASQQLLYGDRQGIWEIQALVLEHAASMGLLLPTTYLDGTHRFPGELLLDSASENAARGVIIHLNGLQDPEIWPPFDADGDSIYKKFIRPLYKHITGKDLKLVADSRGMLEVAQIRQYIQQRLLRIIERARITRRPISTRQLAALCIAPVDMLPIRGNRVCFLDCYESWQDLDISDQRKLDPEGHSQVAFQYASVSAEFVFHLPLRWAEMFLPARPLSELQSKPGQSEERGIYQGQAINAEESLRRPIREMLQDLGVDISRACPHGLEDKGAYLAKPAIRDALWPTRFDEQDDWEDDPWDCFCLPPRMV
ncbi:MAG TPA: hypothetical protein VGD98_05805 [Ktedonobacteraceae bacterium]